VSFHRSIAETEHEAYALRELTQTLGDCDDPAAVFGILQEQLPRLIPYALMVIYRLRGECLIPEYLDGEDQQLFASLEIPLGMGLAGWVAENRKCIVNGNPGVEPGYLSDPTKFSMLRSALAVPLEAGGVVSGVLSLYRHEHDAFNTEHLTLLLTVATRMAHGPRSAVPALQCAGDRR
jgi:GAF domain-containing protein